MDMILEISPNDQPKLPTLRQWLSTPESAKLRAKYHCTFVWFPGQYPNLTFQTECFRVLVSEDSPIFGQCLAFAKHATETDQPFAIVVGPDRDGSFGISTSGEKGKWDAISTKGSKWVPDQTKLKR